MLQMNRPSVDAPIGAPVKVLIVVLALCPIASSAGEQNEHNPKAVFLASGSTIATIGDKQITITDIQQVLERRLLKSRTDTYNALLAVVDNMVESELLNQEAKRRKLSPTTLIEREINAKVAFPTDLEARAVYEATKFNYSDQTETAAIKVITEKLRQDRLYKRRVELLSELRGRYNPEIHLEPPRAGEPIGIAPWRGANEAPITIVTFSDFECRYCANIARSLARLQHEYPNQVKTSFRHFPLPMHRQAVAAAEASLCAEEQGKFWEMHDILFENFGRLAADDLLSYGEKIQLDQASFDLCVKSRRTADRWRRDKALAGEYGIVGTPTVFLNGRMIQGAPTYEALLKLMNEELARIDGTPAKTSESR
jgi:predicted DsbA family dithiol-disulfide isomerase